MGRFYSVRAYLILQLTLYLSFLALDLFCPGSTWDIPLKYCSILLCFLWSLPTAKTGDGRLVCAALGLTLFADLFLLVLDQHYLLGIICFCGVQFIYLLRIYRSLGRLPLMVLRISLSLCTLLCIWLEKIPTPLFMFTLFYFIQLVVNALESIWLGYRCRLFPIGLFLFIGCDLCVGLMNLSAVLSLSVAAPFLSFARVGMWLFYLPSQVMISLSAGKL